MAHAADERDLVLLEAHAGAAPVAQAPPGQLVGDVLDRDARARRAALDHDDEGRAVGLTGGQEAQHRANLPAGRPPEPGSGERAVTR